MTDYDPFNDFWGDIITGVAVTIITTQIVGEAKNEKSETRNEINKTGRNENVIHNIGNMMDDIVIFISLYAINIYLFITWWEYVSIAVKVIGIYLLCGVVLYFTHAVFYLTFGTGFLSYITSGLFGKIARKLSGALVLINLEFIFLFSPNLIRTSTLEKFCVNEYTSERCKIDRVLRWISGGLLFIACCVWISFCREEKKAKGGGDIKKQEGGGIKQQISRDIRDNKVYIGKIIILILFTSAIVLQAVGNGYLLSKNFWQTKITTALAIVSIARLFNNCKMGSGTSIFASVFAPGYRLDQDRDVRSDDLSESSHEHSHVDFDADQI